MVEKKSGVKKSWEKKIKKVEKKWSFLKAKKKSSKKQKKKWGEKNMG